MNRRGVAEIKACASYRGPMDPLRGDEPNKKCRAAAAKALEALFDETPSAQRNAPNAALSGRIVGHGTRPAQRAPTARRPSASTTTFASSSGNKYGGMGNPNFADPRSSQGGSSARSFIENVAGRVQRKLEQYSADQIGSRRHPRRRQQHHQSSAASRAGYAAPSAASSGFQGSYDPSQFASSSTTTSARSDDAQKDDANAHLAALNRCCVSYDASAARAVARSKTMDPSVVVSVLSLNLIDDVAKENVNNVFDVCAQLLTDPQSSERYGDAMDAPESGFAELLETYLDDYAKARNVWSLLYPGDDDGPPAALNAAEATSAHVPPEDFRSQGTKEKGEEPQLLDFGESPPSSSGTTTNMFEGMTTKTAATTPASGFAFLRPEASKAESTARAVTELFASAPDPFATVGAVHQPTTPAMMASPVVVQQRRSPQAISQTSPSHRPPSGKPASSPFDFVDDMLRASK